MSDSRNPPLGDREYVSISDAGRHETLTNVLGLEPSDAWNAGDINPRNGKPRQTMHWQLRAGLDDTRSLREHIDALLAILGSREDAVRALWVDYDLTLQCVGYFPSTGHGAHLDRDVVRRAARLGLAFDLDFYFVDDPDA